MANELGNILSQIDDMNRRLANAEAKIPVSYGGVFNARLSLSWVNPVMEAIDATALFLTPYLGYNIGIYVPGSDSWHIRPLPYPIYIKVTDEQTGTTLNGSKVITGLTDTSQFIVGMLVTGTGIGAAPNTIASIDSATQVTLTVNSTASAAVTITFKMPLGAYDVLVYTVYGKLKLSMVKWNTVNARVAGKEVVLKNGIYVYDNDKNYRYCGSVYLYANGLISDNIATRHVWNYHNRVPRVMYCAESTSHPYNGAFRKWNYSDTNNLVSFIVGIIEDAMSSSFTALIKAGADGSIAQVRPYYDNVALLGNSPSSNYNVQYASVAGNATVFNLVVGYHYLQIYEYGNHDGSRFNDFTFYVDMIC